MKWLVLSCFLLWARHGEGGALKCLPEDDACLSQKSQEVTPQEIEIRRPSGLAECLSGSEWESNCHTCRCIEGEARCQRQPGCESIGEPIRCKPDTNFERECNACHCLESGLGVCTVKQCASETTEAAPPRPIVPKGVDCAPGTTWQSQCNDCVCSPDGVRHCTEKACPGQETESILRCAPQSQWKYDCNMCWCNSGRAMCTKMGCMAIPSDMHFEDRIGDPKTKQVPEPYKLPEIPDMNINDIELDRKDQKHVSENLEDLDTTTEAVEDNLRPKNIKELEDLDHNDIDTPIQIPDQVMTDFAANSDSKVVDEDLELLEALLSHGTQDSTKNIATEINTNELASEHNTKELASEDHSKELPSEDNTKELISKISTQELALEHDTKELVLEINSKELASEDNIKEASFNDYKRVKDVEILDEAYINQNGQVHRAKRSACKPNEEFQNDCNLCKCSESGQSYACTQNECMDKDEGKGEEEDKGVDKEVEVFMETEGKDHVEKHSVCKASTTFYVGCNPCRCNSDGTDFSCTNKPCPLPEDVEVFHELHKTSPKNVTKKVCVENRMFIMDCNTCWCNEDGTSYFCTRKVCTPGEPAVAGTEKLRVIKRECRPDEVFEIDCNMCRCNADGKSYSCTRRACFDEETKNKTQIRKTRGTPQEQPKVCQPGQEFRMDCNKCLCDNVGENFSCTRIDCAAGNNNHHNGNRRRRDVSQKVSADCVPGSVFDQGCNVCRCTEDGGHATCTLKRCPSKENATLSATESSFRCNPGEQFKQSCNDCSCSADGKSVFCTLLVCDDELSP